MNKHQYSLKLTQKYTREQIIIVTAIHLQGYIHIKTKLDPFKTMTIRIKNKKKCSNTHHFTTTIPMKLELYPHPMYRLHNNKKKQAQRGYSPQIRCANMMSFSMIAIHVVCMVHMLASSKKFAM